MDSLPVVDMPWPPVALANVTPALDSWSAWYAGNPAALSAHYQRQAGSGWSRRGGLAGAVSRFFWGQTQTVGQPRTKLHVPIAADIATASADLLFAEDVKLNTPEGMADADRARFDDVLEGIGWANILLESAEVAAALGGSYLRTGWDKTVADHPLVTVLHADQAWPEFRYGRLQAVTFWQVVRSDDTKVWRHLERHGRGFVEHGLYEGTPDKLGRQVSLLESEVTAGIGVDEYARVATGFDGLTVAYLPNMKPNRQWRTDPVGRDLGRSDFAGVEPLMDALDETYTSWMRDLRLGKARILVPDYMLKAPVDSYGRPKPGGGLSVDLEQEVYAGLNMLPSEDGKSQITMQQFAIRTQEHASTATALLSAILRGAGYSAQTFGLAEDADRGDRTATEVTARERRSGTTREKKTRYAGTAMTECLRAVTAIDRVVFGKGPGEIVVKPEFPAASMPSQRELAESAQLLRTAQAASTKTLVQMVHPEWEVDQIDAEVILIRGEQAMDVPDPDARFPTEPVDDDPRNN